MNWEAISAIGQILGILITFMVGCIAMLPYMRKFNIYPKLFTEQYLKR